MQEITSHTIVTYLLSQGVFLAAIYFIIRITIKNWLQNFFDKNLEELKSKLQHENNRQDRLLSALLNQASGRSSALDTEMVQASKQLSEATTKLTRWAMAPILLSEINLDKIQAECDLSSTQNLFKFLATACNLEDSEDIHFPESPIYCSLYLSDRTWDLYKAYFRIISHSAIFIKTFALGTNHYLKESPDIHKPIVKLFPETEDYFAEYGSWAALSWSTFLYDQIFVSLKNDLHSGDSSQFKFESLSEILEKVDEAFQIDKINYKADI